MLSEKWWKPEAVVRLFLGVLVCIFGGTLLANLARHFLGTHFDDSPWRVVVTAVGFQGAALVFVHRFVLEHEIRWADAFGFNIKWKRAVLIGLVSTILFMPLSWGLQTLTASLLAHFHIEPDEQQTIQALKQTEGAPDFIALACVAIVLAPLAEEILFRGILYSFIKQFGFPRLALWGSSLIFAAIHVNFAKFLPLLVLALVLGLLYEKTGNLLASIAMHSLFNTLNFVMFYYTYHV